MKCFDEGSSESSQPNVEGAITRAKAKKLQQELGDLVAFHLAKEPFVIEEVEEHFKTMVTLCEPWAPSLQGVEGASTPCPSSAPKDADAVP